MCVVRVVRNIAGCTDVLKECFVFFFNLPVEFILYMMVYHTNTFFTIYERTRYVRILKYHIQILSRTRYAYEV